MKFNLEIRHSKVRLISPKGSNLGIFFFKDAFDLAQKYSLDIVELNSDSNPPVCKIVDKNKFLYELESTHEKPKAPKIKNIEFSIRIEDGDFNTKINHIKEFLNDNSQVRIKIKLRGREMANPEFAFNIKDKILLALSDIKHSASEAKLIGKFVSLTIFPK